MTAREEKPTTTITQRQKEEEEFSSSLPGDVADIVFDRKLDQITSGLNSYIRDYLLRRISRKKDANTIVDYILAMNSEVTTFFEAAR